MRGHRLPVPTSASQARHSLSIFRLAGAGLRIVFWRRVRPWSGAAVRALGLTVAQRFLLEAAVFVSFLLAHHSVFAPARVQCVHQIHFSLGRQILESQCPLLLCAVRKPKFPLVLSSARQIWCQVFNLVASIFVSCPQLRSVFSSLRSSLICFCALLIFVTA
jgi:hypothetical protein